MDQRWRRKLKSDTEGRSNLSGDTWIPSQTGLNQKRCVIEKIREIPDQSQATSLPLLSSTSRRRPLSCWSGCPSLALLGGLRRTLSRQVSRREVVRYNRTMPNDISTIPAWLDPALEVTEANDSPKLPKNDFIILCLRILRDLGCAFDQALGVAANTMCECAYGKKYRGNNLGGVKIWKSKTSKTKRWWRSAGHQLSGDPAICYYRAYKDFEEFFSSWLKSFVPKPGIGKMPTKITTGDYRLIGKAFWEGQEWFPLLIEAGYKGAVTKEKPSGSIKAHESIIRDLRVRWIQNVLDTTPDGKWGKISIAKMKKWQTQNGLFSSGLVDPDSVSKIRDLFIVSP